MYKIEDYIKLTLEDRQKHLVLTEQCDVRGGNSYIAKALVAYFLNTTIPKNQKILVCHACHNKDCTNPKHLYWGTYTENAKDAISNGKLSAYEYTILKYGNEETLNIQRRGAVAATLARKISYPNLSIQHRKNLSIAAKGKIWYTNGSENKLLKSDQEIPLGYNPGMTRKANIGK